METEISAVSQQANFEKRKMYFRHVPSLHISLTHSPQWAILLCGLLQYRQTLTLWALFLLPIEFLKSLTYVSYLQCWRILPDIPQFEKIFFCLTKLFYIYPFQNKLNCTLSIQVQKVTLQIFSVQEYCLLSHLGYLLHVLTTISTTKSPPASTQSTQRHTRCWQCTPRSSINLKTLILSSSLCNILMHRSCLSHIQGLWL